MTQSLIHSSVLVIYKSVVKFKTWCDTEVYHNQSTRMKFFFTAKGISKPGNLLQTKHGLLGFFLFLPSATGIFVGK